MLYHRLAFKPHENISLTQWIINLKKFVKSGNRFKKHFYESQKGHKAKKSCHNEKLDEGNEYAMGNITQFIYKTFNYFYKKLTTQHPFLDFQH